MGNPKCIHCGHNTISKGWTGEAVVFTCTHTGCRMITAVTRQGTFPGRRECLQSQRGESCNHSS
jgi:hypothetical protein